MGNTVILVTLNAAVEDKNKLPQVVEIFSRVMAGIALDGIYVSLNMQDVEITPPVGSEEEIGPS